MHLHSLSRIFTMDSQPSCLGQLVERLAQEPEVSGSIPGPAAFVSASADSRRAVVSYWRKYLHIVLVNSIGGQSLSRSSVVR